MPRNHRFSEETNKFGNTTWLDDEAIIEFAVTVVACSNLPDGP